MLQPVGLSLQRVAHAVSQDPVQERRGKYRVSHHLSPVGHFLVCRKDQRSGLIGVTDEGKELIGLDPGDRCVSDLVNDDHLCLPEVLETETGGPVGVAVVQDLYEVRHLFKADCVAFIDGFESQSRGDHGLSKPRRAGKNDVPLVVDPGQLTQTVDLSLRNAGIQFLRIEFLDRPDLRREMCRGIIPFPPALVAAFHFRFQNRKQELFGCCSVLLSTFQKIGKLSGGMFQPEGRKQGLQAFPGRALHRTLCLLQVFLPGFPGGRPCRSISAG